MTSKGLVLHQSLIYPAFLGTALYGFVQTLYEVGWPNVQAISPIWFFTGVWFLTYFGAAYLEFFDTNENAFGPGAFLANVAEVILILAGSLAVSRASPLIGSHVSATPDVAVVYFCWTLIPVTGLLSNLLSDRPIKGTTSIIAFLAGLVGVLGTPVIGIFPLDTTSVTWFSVTLAIMWLLLVVYLFVPPEKLPLYKKFIDFKIPCTAEQQRRKDEEERARQEDRRKSAEKQRQENESNRVIDETKRQANERNRVEAEQRRTATTANQGTDIDQDGK